MNQYKGVKMRNLPFVIWILGFPLVDTMCIFVNEYLLKKEYSESIEVVGALITVSVWICIGYLLFEKEK